MPYYSDLTPEQAKRKRRAILIAFGVITVCFFATLLGFMFLLRQNRNRISDIQQSRVFSCQQTYRGVEEVFRPFFPSKEAATREQLNDLEKFHQQVLKLVAGCKHQTNPQVTTTSS